MRTSLLAPLIFLVAAFVLAAPAARADVGPPPSCPPGTHRIYDRGHKCVPDTPPTAASQPTVEPAPQPAPPGTPSGTSTTQPAAEPAPQLAAPPGTPSGTSTTQPAAEPAPQPVAPQPVAPSGQPGCACEIRDAHPVGAGSALAAFGAALLLLARRRRGTSAPRKKPEELRD